MDANKVYRDVQKRALNEDEPFYRFCYEHESGERVLLTTGTYGVYVPREKFHLAPKFPRPMPNDWVVPLLPERLASRCVEAARSDELVLRHGRKRRRICRVRAVGLDKAVWADTANLDLFGDCVWKMVPLHGEKDEDWMVAAFSDNVLLGFVMPVCRQGS